MEDDFRKNFGMMIPLEPVSMEIKADPNGVPIYAKCPSTDWCACTGACKRILGYDTDPDKVKAYHEDIERRNKLLKERLSSFRGTTTKISDDGKTKIWSWETNPNKE
jgi:hypothetical protein